MAAYVYGLTKSLLLLYNPGKLTERNHNDHR